jgi:hypothetical protein
VQWFSDEPLRLAGALLLGAGLTVSAACGSRNGPASAAPTAGPDASPIAGHWEADLQGDGKIFTFMFDFTVQGGNLGGVLSIAGRDGDFPIAGTVKGNTLHFEQFGLWDGVCDGGTLALTRGLDGGKIQHMTAHRTREG